MHSDYPETNSTDSPLNQLKNAEQLLCDYNEILDVLPDIIYKLDPEGHFTYLSKSITILGYTQEELIGKHFSAIVHPEDLPHVSRKAVLPRFVGKITGQDNAPKLFDERRTGERATRNLVVRLLPKNAAESSEGVAVAADVSATGKYSNSDKPASGDFEGSVGTIRQMKPRPKDEEAFYGEVATFGRYGSDVTNVRRKFEGTVGGIRDIRELKRLEQQKAELEQELFHSQKMQAIGEMAGGIAHDFNNTLGVISGYTDIVTRKFCPAEPLLEKYTKIILSSIRQAADLTGKLLEFARKDDCNSIPLDVHTLVIDTIELLKHSLDRKIEITCDLSAQRTYILGNLNQLKNALINIAINARDAMPEGGEMTFWSYNQPCINYEDSSKEKASPERDYLVMAIRDTGIGMDEEVRERLFEPFFTTKDAGRGTGLGLTCVSGIVKSHKGMIDVESKKGAGTTFKLYFPTVEDIPQAENAETDAAPPPVCSRCRILLIDDEEMFLDVNADMLRDKGYTVTPFKDSREAVAYYREHFHEIDLAIIDLIMPHLNGKECFAALKEINVNLRAIISTGYRIDGAEILTQEGVVGFLRKPFSRDKLLRSVEKALHS